MWFSFDLARAHCQAEGSRDAQAIRHLDAADRVAPQRVRNDPIARELVWELESLKNRLGVHASRH